MVDDEPAGGGAPISVFESGAIMMYLAEKAGRFYPQDLRGRYEVNQWVIWQMANQGPKSGECGHFRRLGDKQGDQSYAVRRFTDEVNRLYGVLDNRLYDRRYHRRRRLHDRRHDQLSLDGELAGQGQDIRISSISSAGSTSFRPARRSARPRRRRRSSRGSRKPVQEEKDRRTKLLYNQRARPAPDGGLLAL